MNDKEIRFAVVGCGHIGKRHAEMIVREKGASLAALCDIRPKEILETEAYDVPFYNNFDTMLEQLTDTDVINICTPNGLHAEMAVKALQKGFHIVIEKPMALTLSDAEKIIHTALKYGKQVFCVMQNRYSPPAVWIKDMLDNHRLGKIYLVKLNCFWNRDERYYTPESWHGTAALDGGTLFTQFSHFVDMMYWLFGDITDIHADFGNMSHDKLIDFEDTGTVSFRFVNGGLGNICYSTSVWNRNMESSMSVIAEKGSIKIGGQYMNEVAYCHVKDYTFQPLPPTNPGNDYGTYKGSAQNHHLVIRNVVRVLKGQPEEKISTNALEGMKVVDIIQRIYALKRI